MVLIVYFSCRYQGMVKGYSGVFRLGEATSTWDADSPVYFLLTVACSCELSVALSYHRMCFKQCIYPHLVAYYIFTLLSCSVLVVIFLKEQWSSGQP